MARGGSLDDLNDFFDDEEIPPENFSGACGPRPTPSMKNLKGKDERVLVYIKDRVEHNDNVNRAPESTVVISCKFEIKGQKYMKQGSGALIPNMNYDWQTHPDNICNYNCGNVMYRSRWVVTAAHCLVMEGQTPYEICIQIPDRRNYHRSIERGPGSKSAKETRRFERLVFTVRKSNNVFVHPDYDSRKTGKASVGTDLGLIRLPGQKIERLMYMPWAYPIRQIPDPEDVFISGYPAQHEKSFLQYQSCSEWFNGDGTELIKSAFGFKKFKINGGRAMGYYTCQSTAGQSGGPVMFKHPDSGLYVRIGLHVQGGSNMNSCTMITGELIAWMKEKMRIWDDDAS